MPVKARLKDFGPLVPEDLQVTFYDDLPPNILCVQCDNVSALLFRDPQGHGYCTSCMKMCTYGSVFFCYVCCKACAASQLREDRSTAARIGTKRIICPNSPEDKEVHVTFDSLKAHLKGCACHLTADCAGDAGQSPSAPTPVSMIPCTLCDKLLPENEAMRHMNNCERKQKELHHQRQHEALSSQPEQHRTETLTEIGDLKTEIAKLHLLCGETLSEVKDQRNKIAQLEVALRQKDNEIKKLTKKLRSNEDDIKKLQAAHSEQEGTNQLLAETVSSQQTDMKNIQVQCERHSKMTDQTISDIKEIFSTLQKETTTMSRESEYRMQMTEFRKSTQNWTEYFCQELHKLREAFLQLKTSQGNLQACFDSCVRFTIPAQPGPQQSNWGRRGCK